MPHPKYLQLSRQICATKHIEQSWCVVTEAVVSLPDLICAWRLPVPIPTFDPTQGLTEVEPTGIAWLGAAPAWGHWSPLWGWAEARYSQVTVMMQINGSTARVVGWPWPATKHHPTLGSLPSPGLWGGKWKGKRLIDQDNDSSIRKAKAVHASKARRGIHLFFTTSRRIFIYLLGSKASACVVVAWEDICHHH